MPGQPDDRASIPPADAYLPAPLIEQIVHQAEDVLDSPELDAATWQSFLDVRGAHAGEAELSLESLHDLVAAAVSFVPLSDSAREAMLQAVTTALWDDPRWHERAGNLWKKLAEARR